MMGWPPAQIKGLSAGSRSDATYLVCVTSFKAQGEGARRRAPCPLSLLSSVGDHPSELCPDLLPGAALATAAEVEAHDGHQAEGEQVATT